MRKQNIAAKKVVANKNILLALILFSSLVLFFLCLRMLPGRATTSDHAILRATAMLLALCIPAFFYLHVADENVADVLGGVPKPKQLWQQLAFLAGALCFGIFVNRLSVLGNGSSVMLFSLFRFYPASSFSSFVSLLTFAFATSFLPYGVLYSRVSSNGRLCVAASMAALYAAISFSLWGLIVLFLFGVALSFLRMQSHSFLSVFVCNFAFLFGAYADRTNVLAFLMLNRLPTWAALLIFGVLGIGLVLLAFKYRAEKRVESVNTEEDRQMQFLWLGCAAIFLLLSSACVWIGGK